MTDGEYGNYICPVSAIQNILTGKWKFSILWILSKNTVRFNELQRLMPDVSRGVLTQQLKELEHNKMVHREVYKEVPPKVEYSLTEIGKSFIPVMMSIMEWGVGYVKDLSSCDMTICIANKFNCQKCYELMLSADCKQN
ncbi:MAG TPA: helix-turn-helix domain-containing protein [Syntrophomonadaceae bacterium]|nr:helix-turn-helix domain-containing protein [Syntrophomonadaceae bacterium]